MAIRVGWLTDIHLNVLPFQQVHEFLCHVARCDHDAVLLTGDIGEAPDVESYCAAIDDALGRPVYFVLGNHDFYLGSIQRVRAQIRQLCRQRPNLRYLSAGTVWELAPGVGLLGHDGWADARLGDYQQSDVMLNDYLLIEELANLSKAERRRHLEALGDEAGRHIQRNLRLAAGKYSQVLLATHVPPLYEACWHEGHLSDDNWLPHFSCLAVGEAILQVMPEHPHCQLTVLCGHTHSPGQCQPLPNVAIYTGGAEYGAPIVQREFTFA